VDLLFPPEPSGDVHSDAILLGAWGESRWRWHVEHAAGGHSELGSYIDHQRAKTAARLLYLAHRGRLDKRQHIPLPDCWERRWEEHPEWFDALPPNTIINVPRAVGPPGDTPVIW
jgi:hypothetical protein